MQLIEIALSTNELDVIKSALLESYAGYAGALLPDFLNSSETDLAHLHETLKAHYQKGTLSLSSNQWRLIYEVINAVIYELGPEELQTITGYDIYEYLNTGRVIYAHIYKRPNLMKW